MPDYGSLTKEVPLIRVEETISAITPNMSYSELLRFAKTNTHGDILGLIVKRFLLLDPSRRIIYDEFLSLARREGIRSQITRKIMLFTWIYRDDRLRRFVIERIADVDGHWDVTRLTDIANAQFFTQWPPSSVRKARSNFERFLVETEIFNETTKIINLELDDNWLEDAARVVAQHELDPEVRRRIIENPYRFLVDQEWNALVNSPIQELLSRKPSANFVAEPIEDNLLPKSPVRQSSSKTWNRPKPSSIQKTTTQALIDLVERERANQSHHAIEQALALNIKGQGYDPRFNDHIDLFYSTDCGSVIVEVKSCTDNNMQSQIRKGVSQLFEYRYLYRASLTKPISLLLALEVQPSRERGWLIDYLKSIGIMICWLNTSTGRIETFIPAII